MTKAQEESFSAEERAAMKDRAAELRKAKRPAKDRAALGEADVQAKIAEMNDADRAIATSIHQLIKRIAPELEVKTWYGMPAYARNGKVVCFFQSGAKFKTRYSTFGFQEEAQLDDGPFWATSFAVTEYNAAVEKRITELVGRALGR